MAIITIYVIGAIVLLGSNALAQSDTSWTRTYGGISFDEARSIVQTEDGGYIIAGWTASFGAGLADVWLIKTDVFGDTLWTKTYGGNKNDFGFSVSQSSDGGYIVAGWTASFGAGKTMSILSRQMP